MSKPGCFQHFSPGDVLLQPESPVDTNSLTLSAWWFHSVDRAGLGILWANKCLESALFLKHLSLTYWTLKPAVSCLFLQVYGHSSLIASHPVLHPLSSSKMHKSSLPQRTAPLDLTYKINFSKTSLSQTPQFKVLCILQEGLSLKAAKSLPSLPWQWHLTLNYQNIQSSFLCSSLIGLEPELKTKISLVTSCSTNDL